ncbi:uncharacterized protein LOC128157765 [Crassostrea angulata]|uniref:uncharacterized protein LOC128157765 n=1 Tax=Magallana angulata TaxID=2784310 RepID=UPI0022B0FB92|nr:uncharacterized protein LOC128157765 [Crassostrea angulata]
MQNHQSQFLFNMETIFIFLLAATIDCVSPFGFHHVGIVSPKQSESKLYNSLFENYKTETNDIPIWKKFHFWKKKRDFWTDDAIDPSSRFLSPENQDNFPPKTENIFSELKPYESFQFVDTQSEPSEDFDPEEMELNDMLQDSDPSDFGSFGPNVVPSDDSGLSGGFGVLQSNVKNTEHSHQTEGFINSGSGTCVKNISLQGTTSCVSDADCKDCNGFVFHCASNFCKVGPAPSCGTECDITDGFPAWLLKR